MQVAKRRKNGLSPASRFWTIADAMHKRGRDWMPTGGYELRRRVVVDGQPWTFCFKLHVVSELDEALEDWAGIRFLATVTIWPPKLGEAYERRITRLGWYRSAKKSLANRGYRGEWQAAPGVGKWGNFEKGLVGVADVRREAKLLEKLSHEPAAVLGR